MAYEGTVELLSGIRPKNDRGFPLVDAPDVRVTDDERLDVALAATVRFDKDQSLTDAQKKTACDNIGAGQVDPILSNEGMAADAKKTGDEISGLKDDLNDIIEKSRNLIHGEFNGYTLTAAGRFYQDGNYKLHIAPVIEGKTYTFTTDTIPLYGLFNKYPSISDTTVDGKRYSDVKTFVSTITGYIAFRTSINYEYAQFEEGSTSTSYISPTWKSAKDITVRETVEGLTQDIEKVDAINGNVNSLIRPLTLNLIPDSYWPITGASAGIPYTYNGWSRTDRIACIPGQTLKIKTSIQGKYNLFFNSDTDHDINSPFTLAIGENLIKVPEGANYFGLSNTTEVMSELVVEQIISAKDIEDAKVASTTALSNSTENKSKISVINKYIGLEDAFDEVDISSLIKRTDTQRISQSYSASSVKSVKVSEVAGFQHNIVYYKQKTSDSDAIGEAGWKTSESRFDKPEGYLYWYIRFKKEDGSSFNDDDATQLVDNIIVTLYYEVLNISKQTVYVSTNGSDTNDGSKTSPFLTIQKAIDSGALVVKITPGNYTGFSVQNRETPLTVMLESMPSYTTDNPEVPKIKITSGIINGYGIFASKCTEINLFDIWVDGVTADCIWLQDIGNVNCTRCFVSNNSANNSMGIRLVSVNGILRDCKAWNIVKDGYNIHRYGNTQFINCVAYDCGDDGISHHDGCTGLISGGEYYRCYKGGISSPYGGSKIDIENVYIHDCTQYGIYSMSSDDMLKSSGRISNCVIKNNGTYDIIASYTDLIGWNNTYDTKSIGTEATFVEL